MIVALSPVPGLAGPIDLGEAGDFAAFGLRSDVVVMSDGATLVDGNVGLGPNIKLDFSGGQVTGDIYLHNGVAGPYGGAAATALITGGSTYGGLVYQDMNPAVADAYNASAVAGLLTPDITLAKRITASTIISAYAGDPVTVALLQEGVNLDKGKTLTIAGGPGDSFVFNIPANQTIVLNHDSHIVLEGGITADNVLFNILGTGGGLNFGGNSDTMGTFLAVDRDITVSGGVHESEFISGGKLTLQSGSYVTQPPSTPPVPAPGTLMLGAIGSGCVAWLRRRKTL